MSQSKKGTVFSVSPGRYKNPIYLRSGLSDTQVFSQVIWNEEYNLKHKVMAPKVIVDCGANIGLTSVYFANKYPNATIIAIEPERSNSDMLKKNTAKYPNVHCLNYGVWNRSAHLEIVDSSCDSWGFMVEEKEEANDQTISAISIDDIMEQFGIDGIDILKMDIEGSERDVFTSNTSWLTRVKVLIVELHDGMRKDCSKTFFKALESYNYKIKVQKESIICFFNHKAVNS